MSTQLEKTASGMLAYGAIGAAVFAGAVALFWNGHPIIGCFVMLMAIGLGFAATLVRTADCPSCGQPFGWILEPVAACDKCERYAAQKDGRLVMVEAGFIAPQAVFATRTEALFKARFDPKNWRFPVSGCCVCGKPPTKTEKVQARFEVDRFLNMATINTYTFEVPHCAEHEQGVVFDFDKFKFRSYDLWRAFEQANGVDPKAS